MDKNINEYGDHISNDTKKGKILTVMQTDF
jgi:hypothetical protein